MANIITLAEYRLYDDAPSPAERDEQITAMITLATGVIELKLKRTLEIAGEPSPSATVEILDGNGTSRLYTRNAPITAVTTLEYWDGVTWQTYDATQYTRTFKVGSNIIHFTGGFKFLKGYQTIRATFEYGFDTAFPGDLKKACYLVTKHMINESDRLGITRQEDGEQKFWYDHGMPKLATDILMRYKTVY